MAIRTTRSLSFSSFGIRRFQSVGLVPGLGLPRLGIAPVDLQTTLLRTIRGGIGGVRFRPNRPGIAALAASPGMVREMRARAEAGAEGAKQAWVSSGPHPYETGEYVNSIEAAAGVEDGIAMGRVNAHDPTAGYIEFGTSDTPAFAPLRRGVESTGLRVYSRGTWGGSFK